MAPGQIEHISTKRIVSKLSSNQGRNLGKNLGKKGYRELHTIMPCIQGQKRSRHSWKFFSFKLKETQKEGFEYR